MRRKSFITKMSMVIIAVTFSFYVAAEQPGGQTIGAGFEKRTKVTVETFTEILYECLDCVVPACLTVQQTNDSTFRITLRDERDFSFPLDAYIKDRARTDCHPNVMKVIVQCVGIPGGFGFDRGCEFQWRIDLIGDPTLNPKSPNG